MMAAGHRLGMSILLLLSTTISAQQVPVRDSSVPQNATGTAALSGTVVNDVTNRPVRRAAVFIYSADNSSRFTAITGDTGVFSFANLPAGRYSVGASKAGYVGVNYGAKRPGRPGTTIALASGQHQTDVTLRLQPGAVITGTVRNRNGEPLSDVRVVVLRVSIRYDTGERTLSSASGGFGEATDDRGVYRVYGLPPDDYYIVVTAGLGIRNANELRQITASEVQWAARQLQGQGGPSTAPASPAPEPGAAVDYAPVFYPGGFSQATASTITVKEGEERSGVDVLYEMTPTAKISGTVVSADGTLPPTLQVNVVAHDTIPGIPFSGFGTARVDRNGRFVSTGLPPGDYTITVRPTGSPGGRGAGGAPSSAMFGTTTVSVNGSDVDTSVTLQPGVRVSGRLIFEGTSLQPPADLSRTNVSLTAERSKTPTLGVPPVTADASGSFSFSGVTPGRYRLSASATGGWRLKSAVVEGRETLDEPFEVRNEEIRGAEITYTDRQTEISGDLLDAAGHPAPEYFIIVFPTEMRYWTPSSRRVQSTRPASDGRYRVQNLPPGDYFIAAVNDVEQGEWYDPSFLTQLVSASIRISLAEGEKKTQSLKLGGGKD